MVQKINVFYEGWGQRFHWATLAAADPRGPIIFEYTDEAFQRGLELSPYLLPLQRGRDFSAALPAHQYGLPGPVYDALPDGWGWMLMDRLFKLRGYAPERISALDRLAYIGNTAMGAMGFEPADPADPTQAFDIPLEHLAQEVQLVLQDKDSDLLRQLALVGGSPHGARPKALVYLDRTTGRASTAPMAGGEPWLVKFPIMQEHAEVCTIEHFYADAARRCGIDIPPTVAFDLGAGLAAFGVQRFDRVQGMRVPTHTLAALVGASFHAIGAISYSTWLQATRFITRDVREVHKAFERAVFNVLFNNRDDHGKNFSFRMDQEGAWKLSPAYDLTFNAGPAGYHHMDIAGEAHVVRKRNLHALGKEAGLSPSEVDRMVERMSSVAEQFLVGSLMQASAVRRSTAGAIAKKIAANIQVART